jgi:hypothetical protein
LTLALNVASLLNPDVATAQILMPLFSWSVLGCWA